MQISSKSAVALAVVLASGMACYYFGLFLPRSRAAMDAKQMGSGFQFGGDLYPIWLTAYDLANHRTNPYTPAMTARIQQGLYGRALDPQRATDPPPNYRAFAYPLYTDFVALPLVGLSFPVVRIIVVVSLTILTATAVLLWMKTIDLRLARPATVVVLVLTIFSYPVLEGLYADQPTLLVAFLIAAAVYAMRRRKFVTAGILMAISSIKPQVSAILVMWLLIWSVIDWKRRRSLAISFGASMGALFGLSELAVRGWVPAWYRSVAEYRAYTVPPLPEYVLGKPLGYAMSVIVVATAALVCWKTVDDPVAGRRFHLTVALLLAATIILVPTGDAVYEAAFLIPGILWLWAERAMFKSSRSVRLLAMLLGAVLTWQWVAATLVSLAAILVPSWAGNTNALLLPIRTAASLPFVVFALLACIAVQQIKAARPQHAAVASSL